jgi:hypothetical protein
MADTLKRYPRGQIGHGSGALISVENAKLAINPNVKLKHTLARTPSGYTTGVQEATLSFKMNIDEDGPERDFYASLKVGSIENFRLLIPGVTWRVNGPISKHDVDVPLDDAVTIDIEVMCKVEQV